MFSFFNSKRQKVPWHWGEHLVEAAEIIHAKQHGNKLKHIPLSANTVRRHIEIIAENLLKQVLEKLLSVGGLSYSWMKIQLFFLLNNSAYIIC